MSCNCNHKQVETQYIGDVQIDTLSALPEYLLAERDVEDELSGDTVRSLVRVPTSRIVADDGNIFQLDLGDNEDIEVPAGQVRAGRLYYDGDFVSVQYGNFASIPAAQFLIVKQEGKIITCQRSGVVRFENEHEYIVGMQYVLNGEGDGVPTTDSGTFSLFVPVSKNELLINMGYTPALS